MGWVGWAEMHPFTIASMSGGRDGLVLMCKKAGTWTSNLYEVRMDNSAAQSTRSDFMDGQIAKMSGYCEAGGQGRDISLMIEGPYGRLDWNEHVSVHSILVRWSWQFRVRQLQRCGIRRGR
jgi:hypothetical protein